MRHSASGTLRHAVLTDTGEAARIAVTRPVSGVLASLDDRFVEAQAEKCEQFFLQWLDALPRADRIGAARAVSEHYVLEMVWLPRASDKAIGVELRALADALGELALAQSGYRELSESPDASFGLALVERYERVSMQLREIAARAAADADDLFSGRSAE